AKKKDYTRTRRENVGQHRSSKSTLTVRKSHFPKAKAAAMTNTRNGIEYVTSVSSMRTSSKSPPRYPATTPMKHPTKAPKRTTNEEYNRSIRIALSIASPRSIPLFVVPNQPPAAVPPAHQNGARGRVSLKLGIMTSS